MQIEPEIIYPFIEREIYPEELHVEYQPQLFEKPRQPDIPIETGDEEDDDD